MRRTVDTRPVALRMAALRTVSLQVLPVLILAGIAGEAAGADSMDLLNGTRYDNIQIVSAKWDAVQYKPGNATQPIRIEGEKVLSILRESQLLQGARNAVESGDAARALRDLTPILAAAKDGDWQKAEAGYLSGKAHRLANDEKEAAKAFKSFIEKHRAEKDWFLPFATQELADSQLAARQSGTAELTYKELEQYGGQWAWHAKLGAAKAILASDQRKAKALAARGLSDEVARSREAPTSLKNQAIVLRGKIFLIQENPQGAIKELTDAFFSAAKQEVDYSVERAEATLLMGRAHLALGGKENLEQAEIWFLRVPALYRRHAAIHAQACDELSSLYEKLGNAARAADWKARKQSGQGGRAAAPQVAPGAVSQPAAVPASPASPPAKKNGGGSARGSK